jgi:hypothetical protein
MAITVDTILDSASITLLDVARQTWSHSDLVGYLNEGIRATAFVKPDMYTVQAFCPLVAGIAQQLPDGGVALIDITDNASTGRAITQTDLALLQEENRFWPAATRETIVENYAADPRTPYRFYVFPPNDGAGSVRITYGAVPAALTGSSGELLPVLDFYQSALTCFVLAKAYAKNSKKQDLTKYSGYMNEWRLSLGLKSQAQVAVAPKLSQTPGVT